MIRVPLIPASGAADNLFAANQSGDVHMNLPFSFEQFADVFRRYNDAVWPAQWVLNALAIVVLVAVFTPGTRSSRLVAVCLAVLWLWMGVVYHLLFFRAINPAAAVFSLAFIAQAVALLWWGIREEPPRFRPRRDWVGFLAIAFVSYALALYPILGAVLGHRYPAGPTFGVPCPTTIFTLGVLLFAAPPRPIRLFVVPIAWSVLGAVAAVTLGMREDVGLVAAAIASITVITLERIHRQAPVRRRSLAAHP